MPIISVKDNKSNGWKRKPKAKIRKNKKQNKGDGSYSERVRDSKRCR